MSWTKVDGDAQCEMTHFLFPSAKSVRETFATVVRVEDITNWRDIVFEIVAYVAMGEAEPGIVAELIGSALTTLERTQEGAEAVVDAVWSHDVQIGAIKVESARRHLAALVQALESADAVPS
jgi:hypothetical protein